MKEKKEIRGELERDGASASTSSSTDMHLAFSYTCSVIDSAGSFAIGPCVYTRGEQQMAASPEQTLDGGSSSLYYYYYFILIEKRQLFTPKNQFKKRKNFFSLFHLPPPIFFVCVIYHRPPLRWRTVAIKIREQLRWGRRDDSIGFLYIYVRRGVAFCYS